MDIEEIYVIHRAAFHGQDAYGVIENGQLIFRPMKEFDDIKPLFCTSARLIMPLIDAIARAGLARGVQPPDHAELRGQLRATEHHLADMRALVASGQKVRLPS